MVNVRSKKVLLHDQGKKKTATQSGHVNGKKGGGKGKANKKGKQPRLKGRLAETRMAGGERTKGVGNDEYGRVRKGRKLGEDQRVSKLIEGQKKKEGGGRRKRKGRGRRYWLGGNASRLP